LPSGGPSFQRQTVMATLGFDPHKLVKGRKRHHMIDAPRAEYAQQISHRVQDRTLSILSTLENKLVDILTNV
jgi:hypothetical protein